MKFKNLLIEDTNLKVNEKMKEIKNNSNMKQFPKDETLSALKLIQGRTK